MQHTHWRAWRAPRTLCIGDRLDLPFFSVGHSIAWLHVQLRKHFSFQHTFLELIHRYKIVLLVLLFYCLWFTSLTALFTQATNTWKDSMLSRIMQLTEEAQLSKPKLQRWLDNFGDLYSKVVVVLSVAVALLGPLLFKWPLFSTVGNFNSLVHGFWEVLWFYRLQSTHSFFFVPHFHFCRILDIFSWFLHYLTTTGSLARPALGIGPPGGCLGPPVFGPIIGPQNIRIY